MKKDILRIFACALLACSLTSCPETTVEDDFGLKPVGLKAGNWSGSWTPVDDDDAVQFAVTDAAQGLILMTEPGKKNAEPVEFKLRRASADDKVELFFAVVRERKEKKGGASLFLMREPEKDVLFTWSINHDAVAAAIQSGQLKGTVKPDKDGAHSHLDSDPANYVKLLEPQFWNWSEPMCLKRAKK
ncbi:hypothetical protein [Prosthecobacter sp.]|uniref:hypothetical protein n=1 Tax=Prosthecobacter sp. TaxID=1965333 RepID=UPI001D5B49A9|nr:hypothetical protein [Prosthecobacter sp.]MCB1275263.1 hypothetical protein [Prosthecobacter sp.]